MQVPKIDLIFQKRETSKCENYRGISLLNSLQSIFKDNDTKTGRIMEEIIWDLEKEDHALITSLQLDN